VIEILRRKEDPMSYTPAQIRDLREMTGAGMLDCKNALTETNGDMEAAVDWLRKKGLAKAAKKSGRVAADGLVAVAANGTKGAVIELNSETDFVARNPEFQQLAFAVAQAALTTGAADADALKAAKLESGETVEQTITNAVAKIGENLSLRRTKSLSVSQGVVASYVHSAIAPGLGKIAVLVALESAAPADKLQALGKQIAMHIAAAKPEALSREQVNADSIERERAVFRDQALQSGKPADVVEKMVEGRIRKFYEEVVLPEQVFVVDGKSKVSDVVEAAAKEAGSPISIVAFERFGLGEGIEKEETDFAAEVAAATAAVNS
jgi:elongation factor Ts